MGILKEVREDLKILEEQRKNDEEVKRGIDKSTEKLTKKIAERSEIEFLFKSHHEHIKLIGDVNDEGICFYWIEGEELTFGKGYRDPRKILALPDKVAKQLAYWLYSLYGEE